MFLRSEMFSLVKRDTPPANLVPDDVSAAAFPAIRLHLESTGNHAKCVLSLSLSLCPNVCCKTRTDKLRRIDYGPTTRKLIITCASRKHHFMANIGLEIMGLVSSNDNAFMNNDPESEIIESGDCGTTCSDPRRSIYVLISRRDPTRWGQARPATRRWPPPVKSRIAAPRS